ncbi:hypothetical protein [Rheinheimera pacifica]|uniref:hypothetical protein n=1 Tax=Rheinheimera pacifica TaxID=173990 RepID=UPI002ED83FAC
MSNQNNASRPLRLILKMGISKSAYFDFERFRYFGVPKLQDISKAKFADRDYLAGKWFRAFSDNNEYSDQTKSGYIQDFAKYVRFCDLNNVAPESAIAIEIWERHLIKQVQAHSMAVNSARKLISATKCILELFDCPVFDWFSKYPIFRSEANPTNSYSDTELAKLVRCLRVLHHQLGNQIRENPLLHLNAAPNTCTAHYSDPSRRLDVCGAVTKYFCASFFLMAYYTWANTTCLLNMKKPKRREGSTGIWYEQSVLKNRANKFVTIAIGENHATQIPKHALRFMEDLLEISSLIKPDDDHLLFQCRQGLISTLETSHLRTFNNWLYKSFGLNDDFGKQLRPEAKRFRATGSSKYIALTNNVTEVSLILGNTPNTVHRHYTRGNEPQNNMQLQAVAHTLESAVRCGEIQNAKEQARSILKVEVLPYEAFVQKYSVANQRPERSPIGTGCADPFGSKADKYRRKVNFSPKMLDVSHLACADILNCFFCTNQVVIEEIDDIWCLLSFKCSLEESRGDHLNQSQFKNNFEEILHRVNQVIFRIDPKIRRQAERKLKDSRHPLWPEELNLFI